MYGILENCKRLKMMKTFGGKRPTMRLGHEGRDHLWITLYLMLKRIDFIPALAYFSNKESHQTGILECYSWEWWDVSDEIKEVELIVFGAKERRVSWSQSWAAGWMVEIFTETLNPEGWAGLGERGGWWMYSVWGSSRTSRWRCLCDYGWNLVQRSRLGKEIEELVV